MSGHPPRETKGRVAAFVCDQCPDRSRSGPTRYNADVLDSLLGLGWTVHLVVTGPKLAVGDAGRWRGAVASIHFLHGRAVGSRVVPTTLAAALRLAYASLGLDRLVGRSRGEAARFGAELPASAVAAIAAVLQVETPDIVLIDTIFRAGALAALPPSTVRLLVAHDLFSARTRAFRDRGRRVATPIEEAEEAMILNEFDAIASISSAETPLFRNLAPHAAVATLQPVAARTRLPPAMAGDGRDPSRLLFIGTRADPNVDGMRWFLREVWPLVRRGETRTRLSVVGDVCARLAETEGVVLHGPVADLASIGAACGLAINPARMGSGLAVKVMDYLSLGLPMVATSTSWQGFPQEPVPPVIVADDAATMAEAILALLRNPDQYASLAARIPAYSDHFSAAAARQSLEDLLSQGFVEASRRASRASR